MYYFEIAHYQKRAVSESQNELVVIGPQEAFIEDIQTNLSLLRHKIKHADLKTKHFAIGKYTKTDVYLVYLEGLCKPKILAEMEQKLGSLDVDGILGISYLAEHMSREQFSLFRSINIRNALTLSPPRSWKAESAFCRTAHRPLCWRR